MYICIYVYVYMYIYVYMYMYIYIYMLYIYLFIFDIYRKELTISDTIESTSVAFLSRSAFHPR